MEQPDGKLMYRPEEAARVSSLSRSTLYKLMRSGELESVVVGRVRLIPRASLERFVAQLCAEQVPAA